MPHEWNNMIVVTKDELVPEFYSLSNIDKQLSRYKQKDFGIKRVQLGGNGRQMLINFDTLPKEIQIALGDPRKVDHILERFYKVDGEAVTFYSTYTFDENGGYLDTKYQERYIINASVLRAIIHLREARLRDRQTKRISCKKGEIMRSLCADATSFNQTLKVRFNTEHTLPSGEKAFKTVLNDFEKSGYVTLISKKHKNDNSRKVTYDTLTLLKNIFAGDSAKPTATEVHRRYDQFISGKLDVINNESGEIYNPSKFKALSDVTVKKYMRQWVNKIGTYPHRSDSRKDLMTQFKPHHSHTKTKFAGSIISIDDRQPPFKDLSGNRPWFYNAIDLGSECFTVAVYGDSKTGIIKKFYQQMVRNYAEWGFNLPHQVECEMSLNSSFTDTILREGAMFQKVSMLPNNPRGKRIERYFRELRYEYEKDRKGWLARPNARLEANQPLIDTEKIERIPFENIIEGCITDIETWNSRKHSVHTHLTRWEVFCQMQHPELKPTNYQAIIPHIGYKETSSVNAGIIRFRRSEFLLGENDKISLGDKLINLMKQVEGKEIDIYWLDANDGSVLKALIYIGTQYICDAIAKPRYTRADLEKTEKDRQAESLMSAYVATIDSFGRKQKKNIEPVTIIHNEPIEPNTFVMPGYRRNKRTIGNGEQLPHILEKDDFNLDDIDLTPSFRKPMKDRF